MFGLQHEVIDGIGEEQLHQRPASHTIVQAVLDLAGEVRPPSSEVVIDVDHRDGRRLRPAFQGHEAFGHRQGVPQQLLTLGEFQVVDHIDQEQGGIGLVRSVAMQIFIMRSHQGSLPRPIFDGRLPRPRHRGMSLSSNLDGYGGRTCEERAGTFRRQPRLTSSRTSMARASSSPWICRTISAGFVSSSKARPL